MLKTALSIAVVTLCVACQSTSHPAAQEAEPAEAMAQAPSATPTTLEELLADYVAQAQVNLTYDEEMAELLASIVVSSLTPDGSVLQLKQQATIVPVFEIITLQHAEAAELALVIEELVRAASAGGEEPDVSILADARTNSLLAMAPVETMAHLKELAAALDVQQ